MINLLSKGRDGEDAAAAYLHGCGHFVLHRNFRKKQGEIDIITRFDNTIFFIEVKNWKSHEFLHPLEIFTKKKRDRMRSVAEVFLQEHVSFAGHSVSFALVHIGENGKLDFYHNLF